MITLATATAMHNVRNEVAANDWAAAVRLPMAERKVERAMVKLASVVAQEIIRDMAGR